MRKPLFSITCGLFLLQAASAATPVYLWDNQEGFITGKSCEFVPTDLTRFHISGMSGTSGGVENLRDFKGTKQSNLINRSLVKFINAKAKKNYTKIQVVGVNKNTNASINNWSSERLDEGYLYNGSIHEMNDYGIKVNHKPHSIYNVDKVLGGESSFWNIVNQGDYYNVKCEGQSESRNYTLFKVFESESSSKPTALIGVYWDETIIFKDIKTYKLSEDSNVLTYEVNFNQAEEAQSNSVEAAVEAAEEAAAEAAEVAAQVAAKVAAKAEAKATEAAEAEAEASANNDEVVQGSLKSVVCIAGNTLNVRDDSLSKVKFKAKAGESIKVHQGWDTEVKEKIIRGKTYKYNQVTFSDREGSDQITGWIADNFISASGSCKFLDKNNQPLISKSRPMSEMNLENCCDFPTVKKIKSEWDYTKGMRRFKARRGGGSRDHAACDLYREKNEPIVSITQGVVLTDLYYFYQGTFALEVVHRDGSVVRYGELTSKKVKGVKKNAKVNKGDRLGYIGKVNSNCCEPMLHFELYKGTVKGALTQKGKGATRFQRRKDLVDPTKYLKRWEKAKF
jgi:murein DD-endopeptidase MepM/ murein hydrolase activator NlpD